MAIELHCVLGIIVAHQTYRFSSGKSHLPCYYTVLIDTQCSNLALVSSDICTNLEIVQYLKTC